MEIIGSQSYQLQQPWQWNIIAVPTKSDSDVIFFNDVKYRK